MNRWAFLTALVIVAGAVGAQAIYAFALSDDPGAGARDKLRAEALTYSAIEARYASSFTGQGPAELSSRGLGDRTWFVVASQDGSRNACFLVDLGHRIDTTEDLGLAVQHTACL